MNTIGEIKWVENKLVLTFFDWAILSNKYQYEKIISQTYPFWGPLGTINGKMPPTIAQIVVKIITGTQEAPIFSVKLLPEGRNSLVKNYDLYVKNSYGREKHTH